jgi:hypothetical protein
MAVWDKVFQAAYNGKCDVVIAAVEDGFPPHATDTMGNTLLHYAAQKHELLSAVLFMLARDWDPNIRDRNGVTPLMYACERDCLETAKALVAAGGLLTTSSKWGGTPLFFAVGRPRVLQWLATCAEVDWLRDICDCSLVSWAYGCGSWASVAIIEDAMAAQLQRERRWSPLRAAFVGCVAAGGTAVCDVE